MAQSVVVVFALLELLATQFVAGQFALAAVLAAALFAAMFVALLATLLLGQAFLSLLPPLHPLCLCLCLLPVLM